MTQFVIANNVNTQLAAAAASGATTLTLASSANLPTLSAGQIMPLTLNDAATGQNYEIVYVTAISGVTLTVTRAQEGTGALNWSIGDYAYCAPTAGTVAMTTGNPNNTFQVAAATAANQASQLGQLQAAGATYAQDTGSANTLVVSLSPAIASLSSGMKVRIHVAANNTGASTLNLNGLGALPIYGFAGSALQGGELKSGVVAEFCLSDDKTTWVLQSCEFGALQIAPATQSQHAVQLGQVLGQFKAITSSGTFTVPAAAGGVVYATVIPAAGGGGGGGSALGSASTSGAAGGGGGGGAGAPLVKSPIAVVTGQVLNVTIGGAGTGGAGSQAIGTSASNGTAGGTTTITGTSPTVNISVGGGAGGSAGNNADGHLSSTVSAGGSGAAGANAGSYGVIGSGAVFGGAGGAGVSMGVYGICGGTPGPNGGNAPGTGGNNGNGYGAGGSGGNGGAAATSTVVEGGGQGGNGTPAYVLFEW